MIRVRMAEELQKKHKCVTCDHGRVTIFENGIESWCGINPGRQVTQLVASCSAYEFRYADAPHSMIIKAWRIEIKKGGEIGFKPPKSQTDSDYY